ncbi:MAG: DUF3299 domain-containing protein [Lewinellaceae bacterium]|nr:DUF3299 domain-containing protein [Lewinellaceae bacterium]MCB9295708.1 DUF3299 domain-containing protein [Lewinellaceae bacterium]
MRKIFIHASVIFFYIMLFQRCSRSGVDEAPAYEEKAPTSSDTSVRANPGSEPGPIYLSWKGLADVSFEMKYHEMAQAEVPIPIFGENIQAVAGKEVQISGYVIPLEETGEESYIVLSAFPYTQCFFCGGAGPESVMDILPKEPLGRLLMDQKVTFRGRLRLNDHDLMYLNYILDDAVLVE